MCYSHTPYHTLCAHYAAQPLLAGGGCIRAGINTTRARSTPSYAATIFPCGDVVDRGVISLPTLCAKCEKLQQGFATSSSQSGLEMDPLMPSSLTSTSDRAYSSSMGGSSRASSVASGMRASIAGSSVANMSAAEVFEIEGENERDAMLAMLGQIKRARQREMLQSSHEAGAGAARGEANLHWRSKGAF